MPSSIWNQPLESLYDGLAAPKSAPAAVTASAVSARFGLALLIKVLEVTIRRKTFSGDPAQFQAMLEAARAESAKLAQAADDDTNASPDRRRSEIPMLAAQAAEAGLAQCAHARPFITGPLVADLEAAVLLLDAARRAILVCVESNARGK